MPADCIVICQNPSLQFMHSDMRKEALVILLIGLLVDMIAVDLCFFSLRNPIARELDRSTVEIR